MVPRTPRHARTQPETTYVDVRRAESRPASGSSCSTPSACGSELDSSSRPSTAVDAADIEHRPRKEGRTDCGFSSTWGAAHTPGRPAAIRTGDTRWAPLVRHPARRQGCGAESYRAGDGPQLLTLGCLGIVKWPRREQPGGLEHALPDGFIDLVRRWRSKLRETVKGCTPAATATSRIVTTCRAPRLAGLSAGIWGSLSSYACGRPQGPVAATRAASSRRGSRTRSRTAGRAIGPPASGPAGRRR